MASIDQTKLACAQGAVQRLGRVARLLLLVVTVFASLAPAHSHRLDLGAEALCSREPARDAPNGPIEQSLRHDGCCIAHEAAIDTTPLRPVVLLVDFPSPTTVAIPAKVVTRTPCLDPECAPNSPRAPPSA